MNPTQMAAFSILMANGKGIMAKHPSYILEKFEACSQASDRMLLHILDDKNGDILRSWCKLWHVPLDESYRQ